MNDSDSANRSNKEELERLIELAPTAIRRQALQQQLRAMQKSSEDIKTSDKDVSLKTHNDEIEDDSKSLDQDNVTFKQTDERLKQDDAVANKVDVPPEQEDVIVEDTNSTAPEIDSSMKQIHATAKEIDILAEQVDALIERDDDSLKQQDFSIQQDHSTVEKTDILVAKGDMTVEETDVSVEKNDDLIKQKVDLVQQDNATVEEADISVEHDDVTVEKEDVLSVKSDDTAVEKASVSPEQNDVDIDKVEAIPKQPDDKKTEAVDLSFEENAVLKQGKQPDNFYVYMRRKSRFSPIKMVLLSAILLLILITLLMLFGQNTPTETSESNIQGETDSMAVQAEGFEGQIKRVFLQIKNMLLGADESTEVPVQSESSVTSGKFDDRDAMLKMYQEQSIVLDTLLKFDEFIALNGVSQSQQEVDVKYLLQSAQMHQQREQYNEAIEVYRRLNTTLERFMNTGRQLTVKKKAAQLARSNWESYRWRFYQKTQGLPLISEEMALKALETQINSAQRDEVLTNEQALAEYKAIESRYIKLLDSAEQAIKARLTVEPVRQRWHQLRDEGNLGQSAVNAVEQHYILAVELESAGDFQKAVEGYKLAGDAYTKALGNFSTNR